MSAGSPSWGLNVQAMRLRADRSRLEAIKSEIRSDPAEARSYGVRQLWLVIPGAVVLFALRQSRRRGSHSL